MYACTRSVFSNKIDKKACNVFKNGCKKIVFITKCDEKNCLKCITLWQKLSASPRNGNPPAPIKNNGSPLISLIASLTLIQNRIGQSLEQDKSKPTKYLLAKCLFQA